MTYPWGSYFKMLLLTGARRGEVGAMRWSEVDLNAGIWTVPAERFKTGSVNAVPLCDDALALLRELPVRRKSIPAHSQTACLQHADRGKRRTGETGRDGPV